MRSIPGSWLAPTAPCPRPLCAPQAATQGALLAGQRVAGIRIQREAGTTVLTASYLPTVCDVLPLYVKCFN